MEGPDGRSFTRTADIMDGLPEAELWMVHGAGHAWAGGSAGRAYMDTVGPDPSSEMMQFFLPQSLEREMLQRKRQP